MKTSLKSGTQLFIRDMFLFSTFTGLAYADLHCCMFHPMLGQSWGNFYGLSPNNTSAGNSLNLRCVRNVEPITAGNRCHGASALGSSAKSSTSSHQTLARCIYDLH